MSTELKPCPFCSSEAYTVNGCGVIGCEICGIYLPTPSAWNTRADGWMLMRPTTELEKALYQCDLMQDEFIRISHLTDNDEIKGLCERAQIRLKSEVAFFEYIDRIRAKARKYDSLIASRNEDFIALIDIAQEALNMAGKDYHGGRIYVGADPKFANQSLQRKLDDFKKKKKL